MPHMSFGITHGSLPKCTVMHALRHQWRRERLQHWACAAHLECAGEPHAGTGGVAALLQQAVEAAPLIWQVRRDVSRAIPSTWVTVQLHVLASAAPTQPSPLQAIWQKLRARLLRRAASAAAQRGWAHWWDRASCLQGGGCSTQGFAVGCPYSPCPSRPPRTRPNQAYCGSKAMDVH